MYPGSWPSFRPPGLTHEDTNVRSAYSENQEYQTSQVYSRVKMVRKVKSQEKTGTLRELC